MIDEYDIQNKIYRKNVKILKYGTYAIKMPGQEEENQFEDSSMTNDEMSMDDATRAIYESIMPTRMEDRIQDAVNSIVDGQDSATDQDEVAILDDLDPEQAAKIAEIMKKFESNIQSNVNSLFENM